MIGLPAGLGMFYAAAAGSSHNVADLFAVLTYTGDGASARDLAGPDMSGGGMVYIRPRTNVGGYFIYSDDGSSPRQALTSSTAVDAAAAASFTSTGISLTSDSPHNVLGRPYVAFFFKKAPRFFDVVKWTGTGATQSLSHALGVEPGAIIVKRTSATSTWIMYHEGLGPTRRKNISAALASAVDATAWNNTAPTTADFTVGSYASINASGAAIWAFLFAHDLASDGVIRACSWTGNGSSTGPNVALGWDPQFVLMGADNSATMASFDTTRSPGFTGNDHEVQFSLANFENTTANRLDLISAGFQLKSAFANSNGLTGLGIAVRA